MSHLCCMVGALARPPLTWLVVGISPCRQIRHLRLTPGEALANDDRCRVGVMPDGRRVGMWVRLTIGIRGTGRDWTITHEHTSVPFNRITGAVFHDLQRD